MRIALLSDTHDNTANTAAALKILAAQNPDVYLHAGDVVSPDMLDLFAGLPFHFVFGNNEYDFQALRSRANYLDLHCHDHFGALTLGVKRIALLHGHDAGLMAKLLRVPEDPTRRFDYLVHGHTHEKRDQRLEGGGVARIINPGAVYRAREKSVAMLDLKTETLTFLNLAAPTR
jgi:putative phosphoesterase